MGLLALNADRDVVKQIARGGLGSLSPEERTALPELDARNGPHRDYFRRATQGHGVPGPSFENFYLAQVLRDETMADRAARWLRGGKPGARRVFIVAGRGHCHDAAIPVRLRRRGVRGVVSVLPRFAGEDDDGGKGASRRALSDYVILLSRGAQ